MPLTVLGFAAASVLLQVLNGAYTSEFYGYPDEPAHYVTGLMVRDYLAAFPWRPPIAFAQDFYRHYPMVAIGHWPPLFYVVEAIWMLVFSASRNAILMLMAFLCGTAATILFHESRARFGSAAAAALALAFLGTPLVQEYTRVVMAEMLVVVFVLMAASAYRRYLDTTEWRDGLRFGLLAAAAILTKPNGLALAILPVAAVFGTRRYHLATRFSFWIPAIVVLLLCGPWYALTAELAREGWSASYSPSWLLREPAAENVILLVGMVGVPVFALAITGMAYELWPRASRRIQTESIMAALLVSVWVFHSFIAPVREARHLIPAIPALLSLAAAAAMGICASVGAAGRTQRFAATGLAAFIAVMMVLTSSSDAQPHTGVKNAVNVVLQAPASDPVLVSAEGLGEGAFIAELAARERRPGHSVLRASKVLSTSNWDGSEYRLRYPTAEEVSVSLAAMNVTIIVLETGPSLHVGPPHHRQLVDLVNSSGRWRRVDSQPSAVRFQVFQSITVR